MKVIFNFGDKLIIRMEEIALHNIINNVMSPRQSGKNAATAAFIRTKFREAGFARKICTR